MVSICVKVKGSLITASRVNGLLTSGMVGVPVHISYDSVWNGLIKTITFKAGKLQRSRKNVESSTTVPWEVMSVQDEILEIGVEGKNEDGSLVIPTVWADVDSIYPGAVASEPGGEDPGLPEWQLVLREIQKTEKEVQALATTAVDDAQQAKNGAMIATELSKAAFGEAKAAKSIAKGRATGYVFDTEEDLALWLAEDSHVAALVVGDNLYIRDLGVPDYWWDGAQKQPLETQKVDLAEYVKRTDYTEEFKPGLCQIPAYDKGTYGLARPNPTKYPGGIVICSAKREDIDNRNLLDNKGIPAQYRPLTAQRLDYALRKSLSTNTETMTAGEQQAACSWLGTLRVIENADGSITAIMPSGKSRTLDLSKIEWILG